MLNRIIKNYDRGISSPYSMAPSYMEYLLSKHKIITKEIWERCSRQVTTMVRCVAKTY